MDRIKSTVSADEAGPVAQLYSRGGRFETMEQAYNGEKLGHTWKRPLCVYNEQVGTTIDSYSGKRHVGTPTHHAPRFWDGSLLREHYSEGEWPLLAFSFKSNLMNSYAIGLERLRMIKPYNPVLLHHNDAKKFGVQHGDTISIESPGGKVLALALVGDNVHEGALGIEHGYGHRELGAASHVIDGEERAGNPNLSAGVNINDWAFLTPPVKTAQPLGLRTSSGAAIRQDSQ